MNKVFFIGNLTRDPDLSETAASTSVCRFSIAVNRQYTGADGERQADFFNCTAWRGLAENIAKYCKKGSKVAVSGSIQMRNYEDNQGVKRTAVDIIAQDVEFLSQRNATPDSDGFYDSSDRKSSNQKRKPSQMQIFDDDGDIPF